MATRKTQIKFRKKQRRRINFPLVFMFLLLGFFVFLGWKFSALELPKMTNFTSVSFMSAKKPKIDIQAKINAIIANHTELTTGVSVINADGTQMTFGSRDAFTAASTTKVITAVCFLKQVEQGKFDLDGQAGAYTYRFHLKQMINQSNNDSWEVLNKAISYSALQSCGRAMGLNSFVVNGNEITAADQAKFLKKLSDYKLLTSRDTAIIFSYMHDTNNEDLIPPAISSDYHLYHKYGVLNYNLHDIAIISDGEKTVTLAIMTEGKRAIPYSERTAIFQEVAKVVMQYNFE